MDEFSELVGEELAGFRLVKRLGAGGMAAVFEGENTLNPRIRRAIKVVRPDLARREEFRVRFLEEADNLEKLRHPNVVGFHGLRTGRAANREWLIMELELLVGESVSAKVGTGVAVQTALEWMTSACEGVAAAHALGIVHRDLKPDNLFLSEDGQIKVLDFGIARAVDDADRANKATVAGTVPGSPPYMAPEVCDGGLPTAAADVYALGITLFELLVGHHPFQKPGDPPKSSTQMMLAHVKDELPSARTHRGDVSEEVEQVLGRALAKDPAQRYATAAELAAALRNPGAAPEQPASLTEVALPTLNTGKSKPAKSEEKATSGGAKKEKSATGLGVGWWAAGVLGTVAIGGGIVFLMTRPVPDTHDETQDTASEEAEPLADAGPELNPWVRIDPPSRSGRDPLLLGVPANANDDVAGFRPQRRIEPPSEPYELHQHEVTWGEYLPWEESEALEPFERADGVDADDQKLMPVTGIPWDRALTYCRSLDGSLPTEEQWEFAARGPTLRQHAWGSQPMDVYRLHVYAGEDARPQQVMQSDQDRTPGEAHQVLFDMTGNAREWTSDLYREDRAGQDEAWVTEGERVFRAVRGLYLDGEAPRPLPQYSAAFRDSSAQPSPFIGFRCARAARSERR